MEQTHLKSTPKDVFLQLFNILTFYLSIISTIVLYIQYIMAIFPDPLNYYFYGISGAVRVASSILIIAMPAYLLSGWMIGKDLFKNPAKRDLKLRKWLTYFTLFISAVVIIVDLMIFVYNFFNGELTVQFGLKVLVVLVIAAAVFGYYLWDLKRASGKTNLPKILAAIVGAVALISIVAGFFIVGTPADQRKYRFDEQRLNDLMGIQNSVDYYYSVKEKLPENLNALNDSAAIYGYSNIVDPLTKEQYGYNVLGKLDYELCGSFALASDDKIYGNRQVTPISPYGPYDKNTWQHTVGKNCFKRTVDAERFKPQKVEVIK